MRLTQKLATQYTKPNNTMLYVVGDLASKDCSVEVGVFVQ